MLVQTSGIVTAEPWGGDLGLAGETWPGTISKSVVTQVVHSEGGEWTRKAVFLTGMLTLYPSHPTNGTGV